MTGTGREKVVGSFRKYCSVCKGKCCRGGELNLFRAERQRFKLESTVYEGQCFFCNESGCELDTEVKPLDCVSFPVYPRVKRREDGGVEMTGLVVHRSCPFCEEIACDGPLIRAMEGFWESELMHIGADDLIEWFSDGVFWSEENLIMV